MSSDPNRRIDADGKVYRRVRKRYLNNDLYEGEFVGAKRWGKGTYTYANGNSYTGDFKDNRLEGHGVFTWEPYAEGGVYFKNRRYEGDWLFGRMEGHGVLIVGNGDTYTGEFLKDMFSGPGTLIKANGDKLKGRWERGKLNGEAVLDFANGDKYTGVLQDGNFSNKGRLVFARGGGWYEGDFLRGKMHGLGLRVYANGNRFEGEFEDGEVTGQGIMVFNDGSQYVGEWLSGMMHGKGVLDMPYGDRYEGDFQKNYFFGSGRYMWADGTWYEGEYVRFKGGYEHGKEFPDPDGKRNGRGTRLWLSGNKYEGEWADDLMSGFGVLVKASGGRYEGEFRLNKRSGTGSENWGNIINVPYECPMGIRHEGNGFCTYRGKHYENYFHGPGVFECQNGRIYSGEWRRGRRHGFGSQVMCPTNECGDPQRHFIGGLDGMYRVVKYCGMWNNGSRCGEGTVEYCNGVKITGTLTSPTSAFTGEAMWSFPSGHVRWAIYGEDGKRKEWIDKKDKALVLESEPPPLTSPKRLMVG